MKLLRIPELITAYKAEYVRTTGKELFCCSYKNGWFRIGDCGHFRYYEVHQMLEALKNRPTFQEKI